jgi:hypothetical protein
MELLESRMRWRWVNDGQNAGWNQCRNLPWLMTDGQEAKVEPESIELAWRK